jgi:ubiquitin C
MLTCLCLSVVEDPPPVAFPIFVKLLNGHYLCLEVFGSDTIEAVKGRIQAKEGIPSHQQRLLHRGKVLWSGVLDDYHVR